MPEHSQFLAETGLQQQGAAAPRVLHTHVMKSSAQWTSPLQWLFTPAFLEVGTSSRKTVQVRRELPKTQQAVAVQASGNLWLPKAAHPLLGEEGHHAETRKSLVKKRLDERKACPTLPPGGGKLQHTAQSCFSTQEGERLQGESCSPFPSTLCKDPRGLWRAASRCHPAPVVVHACPGASASNC